MLLSSSLLLWIKTHYAVARAFARRSIVNFNSQWFIDGTFSVAPSLFYQMLSIHALMPSGWVIPTVYALLPQKTTQCYTDLFSTLNTLGDFQPTSVMMDFELAMHNAVATVWPGSVRRGCFFHYKQALFRRLHTCGLTPSYEQLGSPVREFFKHVGALPFVPRGDLVETWQILENRVPADMLEFSDYIVNNWIGTSVRPPRFEHDIWNHHDAVLGRIPKANCLLEGWHNAFGGIVGHAHPSIWSFLDAVKDEQAVTDVKITHDICGRAPPRRKKAWIDRDEALERMCDSYDFRFINDYLNGIAAIY